MIRFVEANGVSLRCEYRPRPGSKTVVLVHEMGGALESWNDVAPALAERFGVLRYDMRGFGLSEKPTGPVSIDQMGADLVGLLDALGVDGPVVLCGGAVGAAVAIFVAARHPQRVDGLIGLAPATGIAAAARERIEALASHLCIAGMRDFVLDDIAPKAWPEALPRPAGPFARFLGLQLANDPARLAETYRMLARTDFEAILPAVSCDALMVCGRHDAARPRAVVEAVAASMPKGRFRMVESGHFMALQTPEIVVRLLLEFLDGQPA